MITGIINYKNKINLFTLKSHKSKSKIHKIKKRDSKFKKKLS